MEIKSEINNIINSSSILNIKKVKKQPILIIKNNNKCEVKSITDICENIERIDINFKNENNDKCEVKCITDICKNIEQIDINFKKCIKGYHLINSSFINETIWEDINAIIFLSLGIDIYSKSNGSHLSGMDINCLLGKISNKSAKYSNNKKGFDISSYRLTTVCSEKKCGIPTEIIKEINKRKNFDYYSFIVRDEINKENISYDWLLIPSNYLTLDPASYTWKSTIGKRGKNKDTQVGWNTNEINGCKMSITFSMSSQLWIYIKMTEEIKKFIVASATVENKPKYNYIDLFDKLTNI